MNETMKKPRIANAMRGLRLSKNRGPRSDFRAAGELEGARPASNTIIRRPGTLDFQVLPDNSILLEAKYSAAEAQSKKPGKDFFDKLSPASQTRCGAFSAAFSPLP